MKSKLKKIIILFIGLVITFSLNNTLFDNKGVQNELEIPEQSAGYIESFIHVDGTATGIGAHNWTWAESQPWCSGDGSWGNPYTIENVSINAISSPTGSGIYINNSHDVYFRIQNCTVFNAPGLAVGAYGAGINIENCSRGVIFNNTITNTTTRACGIQLMSFNCYNITIERNVVSSIGRHGILTYGGNEIFIIHNNVTYSSYHGIYLYTGSYNVTIENNNANNNGQYGIYLNNNCHNNTIIGNDASGNHDGIYLYASDYNTIQANIANDNADEGIDLNRYCDYNRVIGNIANNNTSEGIQVYYQSDFNIISGNNVSNNDNGIRLNTECTNNAILNNNASYNKRYGIILNANSNDNNITENIVNENNQHGIFLDNSDYSNIINNTINSNELGIGLSDSNYNNVSENSLKDNGWCIIEQNCIGNIFENNDCTGSTLPEPIFIDGIATGVGAHNWTWAESQPWCYGDGSWSTPYIIENLTISGFGLTSGIEITNSDSYFEIRNCTIYNSGTNTYDAGIKFDNVTNAVIFNNTCSNNGYDGILLMTGSNNNTIDTTKATNNGHYGIYLYDHCDNNTIIGNDASENDDGIYLYASDNNTIQGNIANDNTNRGIYLYSGCDFNIVSGNNVSNNNYGIWLNSDCRNTTILNNNVSYTKHPGIYLSSNSNDNNITENIVNDNNQYGIFLSSCDSNNIINNTVNENNLHGIYLDNSDYSNIINNTVNDNTEIGIVLSNSDYNNITDNTLKDNALCLLETECTGNIIENNDCSGSTLQAPIEIDGIATGVGAHNWTWAETQDWCNGSGTWNDPYIIENLEINGFGIASGISIKNSTVSFVIQECLIYNSDEGIYLDHVNNSRLINNNCSNNWYGINLQSYCSNNTISGNTANYNDEGIYLYSYCSNNTISGNTANYNDYGIDLYDYCSNNIISGNTANYNSYGIDLDSDCSNNTISGNTANYNHGGIYLYDCSNNTISGNTANYNDEGIYLYNDSNNNTISGNTASNNSIGIYLYYCDNNTVSGNNANDNTDGIYLEESNDNVISGNTANENSQNGIYSYFCDYNSITGNTANYNDEGIYLDYDCSNNTISGNKVSNNIYGIYIGEDNDDNEISENIIYNNTFGIDIGGDFNTNDNNTIYGNFFLINGIHAMDNGTDNKWNSTTIGNYWDNWTSPDVSPNDGIVDDPYTHIGGTAGSIDYLPIAEDGAPSITINSPSDDEVFGTNAPNYDVTITDVCLFEMWYTLDGGSHNYTFTEFTGTIEQSAWDAMLLDGPITLTFYASDIPGNIGFAEVNIEKDGHPPLIVIISPQTDDTFGASSPSFIVEISDDNLDTMWYSLDGGTTNFLFTTNGTINQTAWAALSQGPITLTFYANDTLGHETSEDVLITKSIPSDGEDPTIVIVIIVVSIVGGVAVLAGVYIFMKKRASPTPE